MVEARGRARRGDGTVAGVDVNPGMLAVARRAAASSNGTTEWHEASAEALPLPDEAFDVVLCQLGLQFVADKPSALEEMRRVLAPGGRLLVNVPGPTPPLFAVLEAVLARHLGSAAAGFVQAVFSLHDRTEMHDLLTAAGFDAVEAWSTERTLTLPPVDDFLWQYVHSTPLASAAAELDETRRAALQDEVVTGSQSFIEDGTLVMRLRLTVATGRK